MLFKLYAHRVNLLLEIRCVCVFLCDSRMRAMIPRTRWVRTTRLR